MSPLTEARENTVTDLVSGCPQDAERAGGQRAPPCHSERSEEPERHRRRTTGWILRCAADWTTPVCHPNEVKDPAEKLRRVRGCCRSRRAQSCCAPPKGAKRSRPYQGASRSCTRPARSWWMGRPCLSTGKLRRQHAAGSFAALRMTLSGTEFIRMGPIPKLARRGGQASLDSVVAASVSDGRVATRSRSHHSEMKKMWEIGIGMVGSNAGACSGIFTPGATEGADLRGCLG